MRSILFPLLLAACAGDKGSDTPADTDSTDTLGDDTDAPSDDTDLPTDDTDVPAGPDADNDGSPDAVDCADADPAVHPGAPELCNGGRDDDCDPATTDAGSATFFPVGGPPVSLTAELTTNQFAMTQGNGEVVLCAGAFHGGIVVDGAEVSVRGAGAAFTTLTPPTDAAAIGARYAGGSLSVRDITLTGGRGIFTGNTIRTLTVEDAVFRGATSEGMLVSHVDATVSGCLFEDLGSAILYSMAMQGDWGSLVVRDSTLRRVTGGYALATYPDTAVTLEDLTIEGSGGLHVGGDAVLRRVDVIDALGGVNFTGRSGLVEGSSFLRGGFLNGSGATRPIVVRDTSFDGAATILTAGQGGVELDRVSAVRSGMVVVGGDSPPLAIRDSTFREMTNTAVSYTCLVQTGATITITGSTFSDASQRAITYGCFGSTLDLTGSTFTRLSTTSNAVGGVSLATVIGGTFEDNVSAGNGAAMGVGDGATLRGVVFRDNVAVSGAAVAGGSSLGGITLAGCTFEGNTATSGYGAVDTQGWVDVSDSTFVGNHGPTEGAVYAQSDGSHISESTFLRNGTHGVGVRYGGTIGLTRVMFGDGADENGDDDVGSLSGNAWDLDGSYTGTCDTQGCQ